MPTWELPVNQGFSCLQRLCRSVTQPVRLFFRADPFTAALGPMSVLYLLSLVSLFCGVGFSSSSWCFLVVGSRLYPRISSWPACECCSPPPVGGGRRGRVSLKDSPLFREPASHADRCPLTSPPRCSQTSYRTASPFVHLCLPLA